MYGMVAFAEVLKFLRVDVAIQANSIISGVNHGHLVVYVYLFR